MLIQNPLSFETSKATASLRIRSKTVGSDKICWMRRRFCSAISVPLFSGRAEYEILDIGKREADQVFLHVKQQRDIKNRSD
jgi:hypothetical protein